MATLHSRAASREEDRYLPFPKLLLTDFISSEVPIAPSSWLADAALLLLLFSPSPSFAFGDRGELAANANQPEKLTDRLGKVGNFEKDFMEVTDAEEICAWANFLLLVFSSQNLLSTNGLRKQKGTLHAWWAKESFIGSLSRTKESRELARLHSSENPPCRPPLICLPACLTVGVGCAGCMGELPQRYLMVTKDSDAFELAMHCGKRQARGMGMIVSSYERESVMECSCSIRPELRLCNEKFG